MNKTRLSVYFVICSLLIGCVKLEKIYTWKRSDGELFTLRWKISGENKLRTLNEYIKDGQSRSYINDYFLPCRVFDDENWSCGTMAGDKESISMSNGKLVWNYWGENRQYESTYLSLIHI